MPEGDTIHRHAAELAFPRLVGRTVDAVQARGKHLLIDVADARVHVHLGMQGRLRIEDPRRVTTATSARASLAIVTARIAALWWRAPTVEVLRAAFAHAHPALQALGPDLLSKDFDPAAVVTRARQRPGATAVGALLLDQRVACGIGNVYKSEVLFLERLDPFSLLSAVDDATLTRLFARARALMQNNLGPWGRTTTVDLTRGGRAPRGAARVHVYRRASHPCRVCGTAIAAAAQGDPPRTTYYCPRCQAGGAVASPHRSR